ncbi:MAG TPA: SDR family NAD(P)-dependent oxidoreductase [Vicinamibacteria bacterium]|nr:SDR family NAD(P)-dependent oxidoreductase [Vicinamibacteria bacterium]
MTAARRVLVTGASSGLGREMARQLALRGCRLAVTARREAELRETARLVESAGAESLPLVGSVTDRELVGRHYAAIEAKWGGLDWAILNAGIGDGVDGRRFQADVYHHVLATNVGGAVNWLEAVLPGMIAAGSGLVAGISSLAAWRGLPGAGAYSASKAALSTLLESTRVDLRGTGVDVVIVCPGFIRNASSDPSDDAGKPFVLELEDGVRRMLSGIEHRKRVVHFPWQLSYPMRYVVRYLSARTYDWLVGRLR